MNVATTHQPAAGADCPSCEWDHAPGTPRPVFATLVDHYRAQPPWHPTEDDLDRARRVFGLGVRVPTGELIRRWCTTYEDRPGASIYRNECWSAITRRMLSGTDPEAAQFHAAVWEVLDRDKLWLPIDALRRHLMSTAVDEVVALLRPDPWNPAR